LVFTACAQIQGLGAYEKVACLDDCPGPGGPDGSDASPMDDGGGPPSAWSFRRTITLTSDAAGPLAGEPVLLVLPPSFDTARARPNGDDVRFATTTSKTDELDYFIESYTPGAASYVWVRVPSVPVGTSTITMFYGNASASAASSFEKTFPNARRTVGGGAGSFTATGDIDVDWFELRAGDTLTLPPGAPLRIAARRVILAGTVDGSGRGSSGGALGSMVGGGPGGGQVSNPINMEGSGGGGYGGTGGRGGNDLAAGT
jgi:hypothetical protein